MNPDLSIIIPVYNQAPYVANMLDSIARQKGLITEIIVIDDASTDNSLEVTENWAKNNPRCKILALRQPERQYALAARIKGIQAASAPDIMFADADDILLGTKRLARVLAQKKECGAELAHFRTQMTTSDGRFIGEVDFDNLLNIGFLHGKTMLDLYTQKKWPPGELWGKIYSKELLLRVIQSVEDNIIIYRLDTVLSLLAIFSAKSYLGCEEFVYEYKISNSWPLQKFVQRMHDFPISIANMFTVCKKANVAQFHVASYLNNFFYNFIAWNAGKMCDEFEAAITSGEDADELLNSLEEYIDLDTLLAETLFSAQRNASKIHNCLNRILHEF